MSRIRVLPDSLANKIAAGEVVERPASVVKELLENALDANAKQIRIEIEGGGKRLINMVDDGEGMSRDDALTAFERHATSKLRDASDLEAIRTLGFRGEALPSIAAVSRLFLRTKTGDAAEGTEVEFSGGRLMGVRDVAWSEGTQVEVRDLFFNVPARRKFLKSDSTETFHITNLVQHYALARPHTGFLLVSNGREVIGAAAVTESRERAYQVLGASLLEKLLEVDLEEGHLRVTGFVSNPQEQRSSRDHQYLFVNGRFVRDPLIGRALSEAYRSTMPSGSHPAAVLFIETPPDEVDVNVHPAKTEVRFVHELAVMNFVREAVSRALRTTRPTTVIPAPVHRPEAESRLRPDPVARQESSPVWAPENESAPAPLEERRPVFNRTESSVDTGPRRQEAGAADCRATRGEIAQEAIPIQDPRSRELTIPGLGHGIKPLGQIRDSYIVATDDEGLLLIDQHVAHERILFEEFRDRSGEDNRLVQPLLIPQTVDLTPSEAEAFEVVRDELEAMGIEAMMLSGRTLAVKAAPRGVGPAESIAIVREVLGVAEAARTSLSLERIRDEIAASLACKAAIKINMPLTPEKMGWLIDELMKTGNPMTCPHGRPIIMRFDLRDIERGFKRPV